MTKYSALVGMEVTAYGRMTIEAESPEEAMEKIRQNADTHGFAYLPMEIDEANTQGHRILELTEHGIIAPNTMRKVFYQDVALTTEEIDQIVTAEDLEQRLRREKDVA
jgi:hypothetical protein